MDDLFYEDEAQEEEQGIDFTRYIQVVLKRKWLIIIVFFVITIPWLIYIKGLPPTYEAFCDIEFRSLDGSDRDIINESIIIKLQSRTFAETVVGQLGLSLNVNSELYGINRHQLFESFTTSSESVSGEYIFRWNESGTYSIYFIDNKIEKERLIHKGTIEEANNTIINTESNFSFKLIEDLTDVPKEVGFSISMFKYVVEGFRGQTDVGFAGPNILRLIMTDSDRFLVAEMVNKLADIFIFESKLIKQSGIEGRKKIIEEKLQIVEKELNESESKLKAFKSKKLVSLEEETLNRVKDLNQAKSNLEILILEKEALNELLTKVTSESADDERIKYVYQQLAQLSTFKINHTMGALRNQLSDLEDEYVKTIDSGVTKRHKKAIELFDEIKKLQSEIKNEALSHRKELAKQIRVLNKTVSGIQYTLKKDLQVDQLEKMDLEREYEDNKALYRNLKSQLQQTSISEAVETEIIDVLDPALVPDYPVNRTKKKKAIMGAAFAFFLGIGIAFGLDFLDKSIKTVDDVKKYLKLNVLGTIPNLDFKDLGEQEDSAKMKMIDQQLVTYDYSPTPIGEAYRSLRTNLVFSKGASRIQTFVLTSTSPGDGKSFTAANLAISIAQHKSNTLLIDADLRRGVLHNTFGVPKEPGFTNYLANSVTLSQIVNETLIPNLSLVSCGSLLPNPSELLGSHQMKRFIDEVKRKFDIVIFDSPPLNAATDAIVIGTQVDSAIVVIRAGVTNRNIARQKLDLFKNVPAKVLGVILNGTSMEFGHDGYSYYHY